MNRRRFFEMAVALPTAAALQIDASPRVASVGATKPLEVDVIDAGAAEYFRTSSVDVVARLCEPESRGADLSGASLRILEGHFGPILLLETDALQRDGSRGFHSLGRIDRDDLSEIAGADLANEADSVDMLVRPSLTFLSLAAGAEPELRLHSHGHCFGMLDGPALSAFVMCLRTRCALADARV